MTHLACEALTLQVVLHDSQVLVQGLNRKNLTRHSPLVADA